MKDNGGPAFPVPTHSQSSSGVVHWSWSGGMSLRDWFAGQALVGQAAYDGMEECNAKRIVTWCYEIADAMLAERGEA